MLLVRKSPVSVKNGILNETTSNHNHGSFTQNQTVFLSMCREQLDDLYQALY